MKKIVFAALSLVAVFATLTHASEGISRRAELVVISGAALDKLHGAHPDKLALFAATPEGFLPIPFQIDQRYRDGKKIEYIYTGGRLAGKGKNPTLDDLDELVFWSGDAGPRMAPGNPPNAKDALEITISDPDGSVAYVYLAAFDDVAPRSAKRYVTYDPASDSVDALYYKLDYSPDYKLGFSDLVVKPEAGGSGEDFVDELKFLLSARIGGNFMPYDLDREQVHSKVMGYIDGPVRARRRMVNYVELFIYMGSTSCAESVYGPAGFSIETPVIGFLPVKGMTNLSTRWSLELNAAAKGMTFRSDKNTGGAAIDGAMSDSEKSLDYSPPKWLLVSGKPGTILRRPGKLSDRTLYIDLFYNDDETLSEASEPTIGQIGASGYYIPFAGRRGMKIRENIVDYFSILPNYKDGDENAVVARAPLSVKVADAPASAMAEGPAVRPEPSQPRKDPALATLRYLAGGQEAITRQILPVIVMSSDNGFGGGLMYVDANPLGTGVRFMAQSWYTIKSYSLNEFKIGEERPLPGKNYSYTIYGKYHVRPGRDFYGLGNDSEYENRTNFFSEIIALEATYQRKLFGNVWAGAYGKLRKEYTTHGEGDWAPDMFDPQWFPNQLGRGSQWTNRVGAFVLHDTRDSYYIPTSGGYRKLEYYVVPGWLGSDYDFEYWYLDLREFITIRGPRKDILALRFQALRAEGGPIPFNELAVAGSEYTLRGFFDGRFRDRDMANLNVEIRHNVWKVFDVNVFYDLGRVYDDIVDDWRYVSSDLQKAWGVGFRITIPPNIVMRGDAGWSDTDQVFYFNFGQTF